jgi:phage portal protein BeeE
MNRRDFIVSAIGAATMAVVPEKKATLLHDAAHHDLSGGFGLAPIKQEGASVAYDAVADRYAKALARSMMQTKEIVTKNVLERAFGDQDETEDGYTHRTIGIGFIAEC